MKIETQLREDHQIKLKVEVDPDPLEQAKRRAAREISKRAKIPGFRPGKAPYHVVERYAGEKAILADAMDLLIKDLYPKIIEEAGIKPYGPGTLENVPSTDPPVLEFIVPLEAEVSLGDYRSIRIPFEPKTATEAEVDRVLKNMRTQHAIIEPVDRPAQEGDLVTVKLSATRKQVEEGEDPTIIRERPYPILIRSENEQDEEGETNEWPFPGFSRNLLGLSVGEERILTYTYPEDSPFEMLRGKEAEYKLVVESVKSRTLPELNDEFAQSQGNYENLEALRDEIRRQIDERLRIEQENEYNEKIIDALVNQSTIKYPPQMLAEEVHTLVHRLEDRLAQQRMDLDTYLKTRQIDQEALEKELEPTAESRLKRFLILYEVAKKEDIQVPEEEIMGETKETIDTLMKSLTPDQARKTFTPNVIENVSRSITADLLIKHTLERLRSIAKGEVAAIEEEASTADLQEKEGEKTEATSVHDEQPAGQSGEEANQADISTPEPVETSQLNQEQPATQNTGE